jgi:hypothetical protein
VLAIRVLGPTWPRFARRELHLLLEALICVAGAAPLPILLCASLWAPLLRCEFR